MGMERRMGALVVVLARDAFFQWGGDGSMYCKGIQGQTWTTTRWTDGTYEAVHKLHPNYWNNPLTFEEKWAKCLEAISKNYIKNMSAWYYTSNDTTINTLISSCCSLKFNHSWNDIIWVLTAFNSFPETYNSFYQLLFGFQFHLPSDKLFQFMSQILDRIQIWRFGWSLPPVDS